MALSLTMCAMFHQLFSYMGTYTPPGVDGVFNDEPFDGVVYDDADKVAFFIFNDARAFADC